MLKSYVHNGLRAGVDADTPENFAKSMTASGIPANVHIHLGTVDRDDDSEKVKKNQLKNIQRYHEFEFNPDSITVRQLPGFGQGEEIPVKSIKGIAKFSFEVVNKKHLDKDGNCLKKTTLPFHLDGQPAKDVYGETEDEISTDVDSTNQIVDENAGIFKCPNPRCIKRYTSYHHYKNHLAGKSCVTRLHDGTSTGKFIDMYISRNGISAKYQNKTFRETRNMHFINQGLPEIDPLFINYRREEIYEGYALDQRRKLAKINVKHKEFLKKIFNDGIKNKRKANSQDVEIQMRHHQEEGNFVFDEDEWLTSSQIKSFFHQLVTQGRYKEGKTDAKSPLKKKPKKEIIVDEITEKCRNEESGRYLDAILERQEEEDILAQMNLPDDEEDHPLVRADVDICALSRNIQSSRVLRESDLYTLAYTDILKILQEIGCTNFQGRNKKKMGTIIVEYVKEKCTCLVLQQ